jgi:uncharacterized protein (TIGR03437 family)
MKYLAGILLFTLTLAAQDWRYDQLPVTGQAPPARIDGTISYDRDSANLFLFGGQANDTLNDLWSYSLSNQTWTKLQPTGTLPPSRLGHTLLTDNKRRRLILFGGQASGFFSDVWAYDIAANNWSRLGINGAGPSNRYGHSAVLDEETNRMIISHGFTDSGRFDDTWAFDLNTNQWSNISPSANRPLRRCLHHAVLDPQSRQMYLYGGCASGAGPCPLGDLWAFDLRTNRWTEITGGVQPAARQHYGISFDTRRMQLILFGGSGRGTLSDTWTFNPQTRTWNQLNTSGPTARLRHQGAYAAERGATYFFGGSTNSGPTSELWQLRSGLTNLPRLATGGVTNAFSGIGGALAAGEYISLFGDSLSPDPQITLNGTPVPAFFAQSNQINLQVPTDLAATGEATIKVTREGESSNELKLPLVPTHPGLFPMGVNEDNTLNSAANPATQGAIIVFYATGQGSNPTQVALEIGGQRAELLFAATSPGAAGLMQINARIPTSLPTGPATVKLRIGEAESQPGIQLFLR